jgi:hypothetical protein
VLDGGKLTQERNHAVVYIGKLRTFKDKKGNKQVAFDVIRRDNTYKEKRTIHEFNQTYLSSVSAR